MDEKPISNSILEDLLKVLNRIKLGLKDQSALRSIGSLTSCVEQYKGKKTRSFPDVMKDLKPIIDSLASVSKDDANALATLAKGACQSCMFHSEECFINILFLTFKSIEMNKFIGPNKVRPSMRSVVS